MTFSNDIFKAYDIRGIYPGELNEEAAYATGRVLSKFFGTGPVAVGRDMRLSGEAIFSSLVRGLTDSGVDVHDLGLVPIDAIYFAVNKLEYGGGVMVTASHNPKDYNGFKMVKKSEGGIEWIRGREVAELISNQVFPEVAVKGEIESRDIWERYLKHVFSFVEVSKIKPLKVVVDAGNGMAGKVVPLMEKELPIKVMPLFFDLDGAFPNHPSNPLEPQSQVAITKKVVEMEADFGVIFDGDTDRLFFVDEKGNFLRADITLLLLAKLMIEKEPGAAVVYNLICSKIVPEKITEWGGRPIRSAVGFVNVSTAARANRAVMGGELSAHYSFRENGYADSGFIAFLVLLQLISESNQTLSELVAPFYKYSKGNEINFKVGESKEILEKIRVKYSDGKQDELDGLTVWYEDWWFNVRPSNTEPLLRVTIEAGSEELLKTKQDELSRLVLGG